MLYFSFFIGLQTTSLLVIGLTNSPQMLDNVKRMTLPHLLLISRPLGAFTKSIVLQACHSVGGPKSQCIMGTLNML